MVRRTAAVLSLFVVLRGLAACGGGGGFQLVNNPGPDAGDNTTQSEPHIVAFDSIVIVGFNDSGAFAGTSSFTGYAYSYDNGATFTDAGVLGPVAGGTNVGDPALAVDSNNNVFFATLASDAASASFIGVARSTALTPAVTFGPPVLIPGLDPAGFQDKEFIAVDATGGARDGNVYVVWTEFPTAAPTRILFSRSTDGGATYSAPTQISISGNSVSGAIPEVGPQGELYVAWQDRSFVGNSRIVFRSSLDGGTTWGAEAVVANFTRTRNAGATATCGRPALTGNIRVNEFPTLSVDMTTTATRGNLYIAYSGDPDGQGAGDEADVFVARSTTQGATWSAPVNVVTGAAVTAGADGSGNDNFFPFTVVHADGSVVVFYYDRRDHGANRNIRVYRSVSNDAGVTWASGGVSPSFRVPRLSPNFDPFIARCYMGDYNFAVPGDTTAVYAVWGSNARNITTVGFPTGRPDPDVRFGRIIP